MDFTSKHSTRGRKDCWRSRSQLHC
uniref:Uncharacterized protein n=1 Tax=Arundo donax TaxID=35708 RepID=A0A0A9AEC4_ARUDO